MVYLGCLFDGAVALLIVGLLMLSFAEDAGEPGSAVLAAFFLALAWAVVRIGSSRWRR
jgi:hypothetical protein